MAISRIATPEPEEDLRIHSGCGGGHDTTAGIPAVIEEHTETNTTYYIREPGGELIARVHPTEGIRYYHFDELGSTRLLTDVNGTVTDRYAYDAYGSLLAHDRYTGSVNQPYQYVGQLGYYTHYQEPDFGLLQLGVRFYDAQVGRFGQRDPVQRDSWSSFVYSDARPTVLVDPTGEEPLTICAVAVLIYKTATAGYAIGQGILACYAGWHCRKCLKRCADYTRHARDRMKPEEFLEWAAAAKPCAECGEICAMAGRAGLRALMSTILRILPHAARCKPLWN